MTSTRRQYAQVARHIIAADIIQYYIHAASLGFFKDNRDEIFAVTINGAPYAKLSQRPDLICAARRGYHSRPACLRALNGERTHTTGRAVNQHAFTRLHTPQLEQVMPHGKRRFRHARRLRERQVFWHG